MGDIEIKIKGDMAMKLFSKKRKDKGFSLVELIVVVAIMAVLIGVLVPTLVRNVEKSKHQKDISAVEEIRNAMQIALASEEFSTIEVTLTATGGTVNVSGLTATNTTNSTDTINKFLKEVCQNVNSTDTFSLEYSSKLNDENTKTIFTIANEKAQFSVESTEYGTE